MSSVVTGARTTTPASGELREASTWSARRRTFIEAQRRSLKLEQLVLQGLAPEEDGPSTVTSAEDRS